MHVSKYAALGRFLAQSGQVEVRMTLRGIEALLGFPLPPTQRHRAWWSNNPNNPMTKVWLEAGYRTEQVDLGAGRLVFRRERPAPGTSDSSATDRNGNDQPLPRRHPGFGSMKGLTTIAPGTDLTAPTGGDWGRPE